MTIVAGTDGQGMELVREIELYGMAGFTPAEAMQSATIVPARMVGADKRTGSIAVGKEADMVLVDGDVARTSARCAGSTTVVMRRLRHGRRRAAQGGRLQRPAEIGASASSARP